MPNAEFTHKKKATKVWPDAVATGMDRMKNESSMPSMRMLLQVGPSDIEMTGNIWSKFEVSGSFPGRFQIQISCLNDFKSQMALP